VKFHLTAPQIFAKWVWLSWLCNAELLEDKQGSVPAEHILEEG
jgi:hypothetical protein